MNVFLFILGTKFARRPRTYQKLLPRLSPPHPDLHSTITCISADGVMLRTLIVPAKVKQTASVIFLHGFGATADDWKILSECYGKVFDHVKWIFPQACVSVPSTQPASDLTDKTNTYSRPKRSITVYDGESIPAWCDIITRSHSERAAKGSEDETGMRSTLAQIELLIDEERATGIPSDRIILGGFSQGAAVTLLEGVTGTSKLGGLIHLSGYTPLSGKITTMKSTMADNLNVFWSHGHQDAVIPITTARTGMSQLKESGMKGIEYHEYQQMAHGYCNDELRDLGAWLLQRIPVIPVEESAKM